MAEKALPENEYTKSENDDRIVWQLRETTANASPILVAEKRATGHASPQMWTTHEGPEGHPVHSLLSTWQENGRLKLQNFATTLAFGKHKLPVSTTISYDRKGRMEGAKITVFTSERCHKVLVEKMIERTTELTKEGTAKAQITLDISSSEMEGSLPTGERVLNIGIQTATDYNVVFPHVPIQIHNPLTLIYVLKGQFDAVRAEEK